jgi:ATP-binding cassette, subfamily F, member 3
MARCTNSQKELRRHQGYEYVTLIDMYLRVEHLYFWRSGREILKDVSFALGPGERLGLVGRNGSGKSTLLELVTGRLIPESGSIIRTPGMRLALLSQAPIVVAGTVWQVALAALQDVQVLERELREEETRVAQGASLERYRDLTESFEQMGGYEAETKLEKTLELFDVLSKRDQEVNTLSGGERMRLALAMVLCQQPDLLLLDEPTNHLDLATKRLLAKQLTQYPGALIVASHDRALLDQVATHTAFLREGVLTVYRGNYTRTQSQLSLVKPSEQKHPKDSSSPSRNETGASRIIIQAKEAKHTMLIAKHLGKKIDHKTLLEDVSFRLEAGDKIALLGANGTGKSTLLNMLAGVTESDHPEVEIYFSNHTKLVYLDQENRGVEDDKSVLEHLTVFVRDERAKLLLALVGLPKECWLGLPSYLSQGQRARLGLATLIASEANLILLDEPTNDLDIQMIELLETTLASSDLSFIFVTHDQRLIETLATEVWVLEHGDLQRYSSLKDYEQNRPQVAVETTEELPIAIEESFEVKLERLEEERLELDERLLDPITLSERDYARAKLRSQELLDELSLLYDQYYPSPLPRYHTVVNGVEVQADNFQGQVYFSSNVPVTIKLVIQGTAAHLTLKETDDGCLLPWARINLLQGILRLCFRYFNASIVQHSSPFDLRHAGLEPSGENWWTLSCETFERLEGWVRPKQKNPIKRKRRRRKAKNRVT